jgi:hypothetical protein
MTPRGFAWEGFFRSLQGDLMSFVGSLVLVLVALVLVRWAIKKLRDDNGLAATKAQAARNWAGRIAMALALVAVAAVMWRAASFASINRTPRADIDRSGVYEQMDTLTKPPQ